MPEIVIVKNIMDTLYIIFVGLLSGTISGLLGVGGGTITIPALVILLGASQHLAQGVSLSAIVPVAFTAAYGYILKKKVDFKVAGILSVGGIIGTLIGSSFANAIPNYHLKILFGIFALSIGVRIIKDVLSVKK